MNVLSLFTGIGGFDLGLEQAGHRVIGQVECDAFCQRVLARRWPDVSRSDDVHTFGRRDVSAGIHRARTNEPHRKHSVSDGAVDLLVGGFPCQDLSVAGKRAGLAGSRSSLFWEYVRIAKALQPPWGLVENVPGLLSAHGGRDFALVLDGLRDCWPVVGYRVLDSQHFGGPQRRRRVWLVGGPTEAGVAQVLALGEGGGGDSAAGEAAGTEVARCLATDANGARYDGDTETFVTAMQCHGNNVGPMGHLRRGDGGVTSGVPFMLTHVVRRLTPLECERLQGFPDGWTCLCQPLAAYADDPDAAALACRCPDSPRYCALGNAVTVNVIRWLGQRFAQLPTRTEA